MRKILLLLVFISSVSLLFSEIIYQQDFEDFDFEVGTQITAFGNDDEWSFDATGGGDNRLDYQGDWGSGYYAGFRGNDFVMGYQHTASTGSFTAILTIQNDTGDTITDIEISYLGRVERVELTRYPEWTVTVNGTNIPSLSYSTEVGEDQMRTAIIGGLAVEPNETFDIIWSSTRGAGTGASCQIGIADLTVSLTDENQVALPTFSPSAGTYYSSQLVSIDCTTEDATIHYTLDGTDPDQTSPIYTEPLSIEETTTVKARAYKTDMTPSPIATAVYTIETAIEVPDLAALRAGDLGEIYLVTGEVILTFQQSFRNQKYIQDDSAAILIDDDAGVISTNYERGDGIIGMVGALSEYGNMLQFVPAIDPGSPSSVGNTIIPALITIEEMNDNFDDYEAQLVRIDNVSFTTAGGGAIFENGEVYPIEDNTGTSDFRTTFYDVDYIGTEIPEEEINLVGILNSRSEGDFITSRDSDDFEDTAGFYFSENFDGVTPPVLPDGWIAEDANNSGVTWVTYGVFSYSPPNCVSVFGDGQPKDEWLFTPGLDLSEGVTYRIGFMYRTSYTPLQMEVKWGTGQSSAQMEEQIFVDEDITNTTYIEGSGFFTPDESGIYYFGWHAYDTGNQGNLYVDDIVVEEMVTTPEILLGSYTHDFGIAVVHDTLSFELDIFNIGGADLEITGVDVSHPFSSNYSGVISAGDSDTATIFYTPTQAGDFEETLSFVIEGNFWGDNTITLQGNSYLPLTHIDEDFEDSDELPPGWQGYVESTSGSASVGIYVAGAHYNHAHSGIHAARLYNGTTDDILLLITPKLANISYSELSFWTKVAVFDEPITVGTMSDTNDPDSFIEIETYIATANYEQYTINFGEVPSNHSYIAFKHGTTANLRPLYVDDVEWSVAGGVPEFNAEPPEHDFGNVAIGYESDLQEFTLSNSGEGLLTIDAVYLSGNDVDEFEIVDDNLYPVSLGANQNIVVSAKFVPSSAGNKNAAMIVETNDDTYSIDLSGYGIYLEPPENLTASIINNNDVQLEWEAPEVVRNNRRTRELLGYNIYRDDDMLNEDPVEETSYLDTGLDIGVYEYYITAVYSTGESEASNVVTVEIEDVHADNTLVYKTELIGNYPNPFNPDTKIRYSLNDSQQVDIKIYDIKGRLIRNLVSQKQNAGYHTIKWNGKDDKGITVASGIYLVRLSTYETNESHRILLLK